MGAYKKIPGEGGERVGAFSVECPEGGAPPGFAGRKPGGEKPVRLTQGTQRACVRSSLGPSLRHHTPTGTPRSTHIRPRTGVFVSLHLHAAPQHAVRHTTHHQLMKWLPAPLRDGAMQDPASELRRIFLPRTPVNKGKRKGRSRLATALPTLKLLRRLRDSRYPAG